MCSGGEKVNQIFFENPQPPLENLRSTPVWQGGPRENFKKNGQKIKILTFAMAIIFRSKFLRSRVCKGACYNQIFG